MKSAAKLFRVRSLAPSSQLYQHRVGGGTVRVGLSGRFTVSTGRLAVSSDVFLSDGEDGFDSDSNVIQEDGETLNMASISHVHALSIMSFLCMVLGIAHSVYLLPQRSKVKRIYRMTPIC